MGRKSKKYYSLQSVKKKKKERRAKKLSPKVNFKKYLKSEYKLVIFKNV